MKKMVMSVMLLMVFSLAGMAESKTESFKVYGNCGMCEDRIETAANSVDGVTAADWNKETKMLEVSFDNSKTDVHKVQMAVAMVGHDTDMHKATNETYDKLSGCCQYDRPAGEKSMTKDADQANSGCTRAQATTASACCSKK